MKQSISRRHLLGATANVGGAMGSALLLGAATSARADASQLQKQDVRYQDAPKGEQRCGSCANFQAPSACRVVAGAVNPNGWCLLFVGKKQ